MQWIVDIVLAAIVVGALVIMLRLESEDPTWEARWHELSAADRARIAAAARSGALLADPEEIDLAAGYARRYRGRYARERLGFVPIVVGAGLIIAGLVADNALPIVLGVFFGGGGLWGLSHSLRLNRNLRETISRDSRP
jgi:hypothetical protein